MNAWGSGLVEGVKVRITREEGIPGGMGGVCLRSAQTSPSLCGVSEEKAIVAFDVWPEGIQVSSSPVGNL